MKSIGKIILGASTLGVALALSPMLFAQESSMPPGSMPMGSAAADSATQPKDSTLTQKVKAALASDPSTSRSRIDVAAKDGVVMLSGEVDSAATKQHAEQVVAQIQGVRGVENELKTKSD